MYKPGLFDEYMMGLMNQVAQAVDDSITQEVSATETTDVGYKTNICLRMSREVIFSINFRTNILDTSERCFIGDPFMKKYNNFYTWYVR